MYVVQNSSRWPWQWVSSGQVTLWFRYVGVICCTWSVDQWRRELLSKLWNVPYWSVGVRHSVNWATVSSILCNPGLMVTTTTTLIQQPFFEDNLGRSVTSLDFAEVRDDRRRLWLPDITCVVSVILDNFIGYLHRIILNFTSFCSSWICNHSGMQLSESECTILVYFDRFLMNFQLLAIMVLSDVQRWSHFDWINMYCVRTPYSTITVYMYTTGCSQPSSGRAHSLIGAVGQRSAAEHTFWCTHTGWAKKNETTWFLLLLQPFKIK